MNFASRMGGTWLIKQTKKEPSIIIMGWPLYPHMKRHVASLVRDVSSSVREFSSCYALAYQQGKAY